MPVKRWAFEATAILVALSMLVVMLWRIAGAENMTLPSGQPFFGDFIAFWSAGRAALDGHADQIHERAILWPYQQAVAPDVRYYAPWNSPPTFLLVASAMALAPYPVAAISFLVGTALFFGAVIRRFLPDARALIFPATAPAVLYQVGTVQAGMLIAGISGLALYWLDKRPRVAGALVGLLAIKPHLAVMWPLLFVFSGRWHAFFAAAISAAAFVTLAGLVFGFDSYLRFFDSLAASQRLISEQRITTPAYASLYANLLGLGASHAVAISLHALSAAGAVVMACLLFRSGDRNIAGAALCAATLLVSPYLFFYDFILLLVGAAMLGAPRSPSEYAAAIFAWGAGLTVAVGEYVALPICPIAAWLVLAAAFMRARSAASLPAPALQP
ncbi:MAG: glycosyltransferase family 87 protein [Caulobacteraceae bacterium]